MPELPEVEAIRRKLNEILPGKKIVGLERLREKTFPAFKENKDFLVGQKIVQVKRRAKILHFVLDNDYDFLAHLKMTGQFIYQDKEGHRLGGGHPTADWVNDLPSRHTRFIFNFSDQSRLFFNDMRVFAWIKVFPKTTVDAVFINLGPDVISAEELEKETLDEKYEASLFRSLWRETQHRSLPIKQFMMNNTILCGVGNIYASEALFETRISPLRAVNQIKKEELEALLQALREIMLRAVLLGGTTFDGKYLNVDGFAGKFQEKLQVYGQEGKTCVYCAGEIVRIKQAGRSSFYCPHCQH